MKRTWAMLLVLLLVLSTGMAFADDVTPTEDQAETEAPAEDDGGAEEPDSDDLSQGVGKGLAKQQEKKLKNELKQAFNIEKQLLEAAKDAAEEAYEALKAEYEALIEAGDEAGAALLVDQLDTLRGEFLQAKNELRLVIAERKTFAKQDYTLEELQAFEAAGENIREMFQEATLLEIGSVVLNNNVIKFDTPPYVKNGRTVVPVRALTEGLGAEVAYDAATQQVTITNPETGMVIVLTLGSNEALVNGETVLLDSMAEATNSRTYVPIRFVAETFGLTVDWDGENSVIDIDEEEPAAEEPAAEEPAAEEPAAEEPAAEEPAAEEPAAEEPAAEEPVAEEPAAEEPPVTE